MDRKLSMNISIDPNTYFLLAVLLLIVPLRLLVAWVIAVVFHEACHWLAVKLLGGEIYAVSVGIGGAKMESSPQPDWKVLIATLAGPVGGLVLTVLSGFVPLVALCSWILSMYNLLPVYPLDGGRALAIFIKEPAVFCGIQTFIILILVSFSIYACFVLRFGILPLCIIGGLCLKNRKTPCKDAISRVQ